MAPPQARFQALLLPVRDGLYRFALKLTADHKVWTRGRTEGIAQMEESFRRLRTDRVDLMQAWNVTDGGYGLQLLREWKSAGLCRYVGITTSQWELRQPV